MSEGLSWSSEPPPEMLTAPRPSLDSELERLQQNVMIIISGINRSGVVVEVAHIPSWLPMKHGQCVVGVNSRLIGGRPRTPVKCVWDS